MKSKKCEKEQRNRNSSKISIKTLTLPSINAISESDLVIVENDKIIKKYKVTI